MVISQKFQDFLDASMEASLILPAYKPNNLKVEFGSTEELDVVYNGQEPPLPFAASDIFEATIKDWRRLTAHSSDCKTVYELTFDVTGSNFNFKPGDTIGIIARNVASEVDLVIKHLELSSQAHLHYTLKVTSDTAKIPPHIPVKASIRYVLTDCVDLRGVVKKLFLLALSKHTTDDSERRILEYLCSKEGSTAYTTYILNNKLCILDLFKIFKSCKPPIEVLLANLPRLLPRPYSVANSSRKTPNALKICFSVMNIGNGRKGLVTGQLDSTFNKEFDIEENLNRLSVDEGRSETIPIYIRKNLNGFSLPENINKPLIFIGHGTGVAPFIGFLEEIQLLKEDKTSTAEIWTFFGCRNPKLDFIYERELNDFVSKGVLSKLLTAFSRVENNGIKYVQDALLLNGEHVTKLLNSGAAVYVCGDHKTMAVQVKRALVDCLVKYNDVTLDEAEKTMGDMERQKRYIVDIWS